LLLQPKAHFIVVNQLAAVRLRNALSNSRGETVLFFHQTQRGILHKAFGIRPGVCGYTRKLGFLLRCEMHFHGLNVKTAWRYVNSTCTLGVRGK
jgi:hypothetical protein